MPGAILAIAMVAMGFPTPASAQQDPFGAAFRAADDGGPNDRSSNDQSSSDRGPSDGGRGTSQSTTESAADSPGPPSPTVRYWAGRAAKGPIESAEAIVSVMRLGRIDVASRILEAQDFAKLSESDLLAVAQRVGPAERLKLLASPETGDAARAALKQLTERISAIRQDPQSLAAAVQVIADQSTGPGRVSAVGKLSRGGAAAVGAIINHLVQASDSSSSDALMRIALQVDPQADQALRQLVIYGQPAIQQRAGQWLARLDSNGRRESPIAAPAVSPVRIQMALDETFETLRNNVVRRDADNSLAIVWVINEDRTAVTPVRTRALIADYRRVVDAAVVRRQRLGYASAVADRDHLAADVGYRVIMNPDWGDRAAFDSVLGAHQIDGAVDRLAALVTLGTTLNEALDRDDHPAMAGLVRLLRDQMVDRLPAAATPAETTSALVRAATCGVPLIRYEAALALRDHYGDLSHAGRSYVDKTLGEMRSLGDRPTVVLLETRVEIALLIEPFLRSAGFEVERFSSVASVVRFLDRGGDIRMILSKRQISDRLPIEMVDLVRRMPTMRHVPIVFFNEPAIDDELGFYTSEVPVEPPLMPLVDKRFDAVTMQIDFPRSMSALRPVQREQSRRQRVPPPSITDRRFFADAAAGG